MGVDILIGAFCRPGRISARCKAAWQAGRDLAGQANAGPERPPIAIRRQEALQDPGMGRRVGIAGPPAAAFRMQHDDAAGEAVREGLLEGPQIGPGAERGGGQQELDIRQRQMERLLRKAVMPPGTSAAKPLPKR